MPWKSTENIIKSWKNLVICCFSWGVEVEASKESKYSLKRLEEMGVRLSKEVLFLHLSFIQV
jgi:hypothetical protein